jgi:outer membrane biosynthesis protein TonB
VTHDLLAELAGYTNELAGAVQRGRDKQAAAVRAEIERVRATIAERAEILEAKSADHTEAGQDLKAAQAAIQARELRQALDTLGPAADTQEPDPDPDPDTDTDPDPDPDPDPEPDPDPDPEPDPEPEPEPAAAARPRRTAGKRGA